MSISSIVEGKYGKRVCKMCYYIRHGKIDAEDATQEVFIQYIRPSGHLGKTLSSQHGFRD